jgi:hypothetical protein
MESFSVLHDSWAQTTVEDVNPPGASGVLHDRVDSIYWSPVGYAAYGFALTYLTMGMRNQLIGPQALLPLDTAISDNLMSANVSYRTAPGGQVDTYYPSPWLDWNNSPVQATYNARGQFYMGLTRAPR